MALEDLDDNELAELGQAVVDELRHRALLQFEPKVVADEAFLERFDSKGWAADPVILGGLLVCCGSLRGRPGGHRCSFTSINGDAWVWEVGHEHDELRWADDTSLATVTIVLAIPGLLCTQVESTADRTGHHRKSASSWKVVKDRLEPTATPSRTPDEHRR